ncbi:hypothetical protein LCI18_001936 [Fusarium solani-melongenae]|uniref:Uncharacterized protein n=1 Tax=Fusarium solani subsp. cucurbitae TaxID=2747967 RepID=A0ACD3YPX5_FUSSC|nr:hypothetical protein LCI18_001936 [Fusarium solani-melongenae]
MCRTMYISYSEYSNDAEIASFFAKTSATRSACDVRARDLAGGSVAPVEVQGVCSYSVYAGPDLEFVVQFRLKSLYLKTETSMLARKIYGALAPKASFEGQMGENIDGKEPLYVYMMSRIRGITHLDFILAHSFPENSQENFALRQTYVKELRLLLDALPGRFHAIIQNCVKLMDAILSLSMVLLYRDFGTCNIMVDETSCRLMGVVDWAEAEVCPFGLNLDSLQALTGKLHLRDGWIRYEDYASLQYIYQQAENKLVLTHGDLSNLNILIHGDTVVGIVDWETAGWFPPYWEYTTAKYVNPQNPCWADPVDQFITPMPEELRMETIRRKYFGDF